MIDKILKIFEKEKLFITIKPEILREIVEKGRNIHGTYKELAKVSKVSSSSLHRFTKNVPIAVSSNLLIDLTNSVGAIINKDNIIKIQTNNTSYPLSAKMLFLKYPFSILDELDYYLLGAIASDGSVYSRKISLRISPEDVEFSAIQIFTLTKLAEKVHRQDVHISIGIDRGKKKFGKPTTDVYISSSIFQIFLEKILKVNFGTNYSVPYWLYANKEFVYPWLAGLADGDGYIWRNINKYGNEEWFLRIDNGSSEPLSNIKKLLTKQICDFSSEPRQKKGTNDFVLTIATTKILQEVFPRMLPFVFIEQKRERIIQALDYLQQKGIDTKIPESQRTTRNPVMDKIVEFLKERNLLAKLQNWEKLETYGKKL